MFLVAFCVYKFVLICSLLHGFCVTSELFVLLLQEKILMLIQVSYLTEIVKKRMQD